VADCSSRQEAGWNQEVQVPLLPKFQTESVLETTAVEYHTSTHTDRPVRLFRNNKKDKNKFFFI